MTEFRDVATRALACLDLTDLSNDCDPGAIRELTSRAFTDFGPTAAVCIWPRFVAQAREIVGERPLKIATVVNFPSGEEPASEVVDMTEQAVADGADEIDMVIPYQSFLEGREQVVVTRVERVKRAAGSRVAVKAILETGVLNDRDAIRAAADLAIEGGADFIKTSTGKVAVNATHSAARVMLEAIRDADRPVGFKAAGGVKTTRDAGHYLDLADEIMGAGWATPETFRIGASGVLDDLLATLRGEAAPDAAAGY